MEYLDNEKEAYDTMEEPQDTSRRGYEYIVVGCGGVGSAALYWLSKRAGKDVLGLEQFELGHNNGGSQDHSRIIRLAYVDERYAKLAPDAYKAWYDVEQESGLKLVHVTGGVQYGKKSEIESVFDHYAAIMKATNIRFERLSGSQLHQRFPQFHTDDSYIALYQPDAGLVAAALGNSVHIQLARAHGATVIEKCTALRIEKAPSGRIMVYTPKGVFHCKRLVITPGAWINQLLDSIGVHIPVYITQEQVTYFATPNVKDFTKERFPIWRYQSDKLGYGLYGIPIYGNSGTKIGIDVGGPIVTPETRTFIPDPIREKICIEHLKKTIPGALGPKLYTKTCLYTMPPDRHFVIDTCATRGWDDVIICCGAGHIYKFAGIVGKILSEVAIDGKSQYDISKFSLNREALTVPGWKPVLYKDTGGRLPVFRQESVQVNKSKL